MLRHKAEKRRRLSMQSDMSSKSASVGAASSDDLNHLNDLLYDDEEMEKRKKE